MLFAAMVAYKNLVEIIRGCLVGDNCSYTRGRVGGVALGISSEVLKSLGRGTLGLFLYCHYPIADGAQEATFVPLFCREVIFFVQGKHITNY